MGAKILVAEDNENISSFLADHLAMMGHAVTVVDDGVKLLAQADGIQPHLIITDVQMPGGFGSTAYQSLQKAERTRHIPVLFISARPQESFMTEGPSIRFIQKPLDLKKFSEFVAELLPLGGYRPE